MLSKLKTTLRALKSRTLIFFAAVLPLLPDALDALKEQLPQLQSVIPANTYKAALLIAIVGGIVLRLLTSKPLSEK